MMKVLITWVLFVSISSITSDDSAFLSSEFEATLDSFVHNSMRCHHIPGMTLAIVKGNETWTRGYGKKDIHLDKNVNSNTKFNIASLTKAFTATLLGILLSEKGLTWTVKVTDILGPDYEFIDSYRTKELTIRDLLSHRTGLARLDFGVDPVFPKSLTRAMLCKRLKYLPEERPVRDHYIYNNYMYMMLGHVAEKLGKDTWENLVTRKILQPLGMNETTFLHLPSDILQPNVAKPYLYMNGAFQNGTLEIYDLHPWEPACSILSNAEDMAKWMKFHLQLGKTESGVQVLKKEMMTDMHTVTSSVSGSHTKPRYQADDISIGYGYAWHISEYRGYRRVWHSGSIGSYRSRLWMFPDVNLGIFISVNGPKFGAFDDYHRQVTLSFIADHLIGLKPWLNETTACSYPQPWHTASYSDINITMPCVLNDTSDLEGLYVSPLFPDIEVSSNASYLLMKSNIVRAILHPFSVKDRFVSEVYYPQEYALRFNSTSDHFNITFNRNENTGVVSALTLHLEVDLRYKKRLNPNTFR